MQFNTQLRLKMFAKALILALLAFVHAEPPTQSRRAPYAPAGWQPRIPFNLPGEATAPMEPQRLIPTTNEVDISKQRVDFAGSFNAPQSNYLPPQFNAPNQQDLPTPNQPDLFNNQKPQMPERELEQKPASQYGPPAAKSNVGFAIVYPDDEDNEDTTNQNQADISANRLQFSNKKQGRYYIVSPDNKIQRVLYRTSPSERAAEGPDGFTAELKYSTVGEVQDPIYRYNNEGQLVRVLKR